MPKKRPADERDGARASKLPRRKRKRNQQHLYLVLDDWEKGYSIRKLDLSSSGCDSDDDDGDLCPASRMTERRLPPSVFRLEAPHGRSGLFAGFGTKIVATHHTPSSRSALLFDVRTRALTFGPRHKYEPYCYGNAYVEVDGDLLVLDVGGTFEMLESPPPTPSGRRNRNVEIVWEWEELPVPPFPFDNIISQAVHPDDRTVFYSTEFETETAGRFKGSTFSFDTAGHRWTRHGEWLLPFKGRGYFDADLDAWVGLSGDRNSRGHLCACEVLPAGERDGKPPLVKLGVDKMFGVDPAEKHIGATLVYMGGRSRFCLVECLSVDDRRDRHLGGVPVEAP